MLLPLLGASLLQGATAALPALPAAIVARVRQAREALVLTPVDGPRFVAGAREVTGWRRETLRGLEPTLLAAAVAVTGAERPLVTRCVKLNNPWCIKRARWPGEIGADGEGHTAFATVADGADAAARLLRSYYAAFGRRSALAIVRRWAPAECGGLGPSAGALGFALRGVGFTLRARFLASHPRGGSPRPGTGRRSTGRVRVSIVPLHALPAYRVPEIASGLGERAPAAPSARQPSARTPSAGAAPRARPVRQAAAPDPRRAPIVIERIDTDGSAAPACGGDEGRIANYAGKIAGSIGVKPDADLRLFGPDGRPTENLAPVLLAMSAVELGALYASPAVIEAAVARLAGAIPAVPEHAALPPSEP